MSPITSAALPDGIGAPYRSEAFAEDLDAWPADAAEADALPWNWSQAGVAVLLCAVPLALALLGGAAGLLGGAV